MKSSRQWLLCGSRTRCFLVSPRSEQSGQPQKSKPFWNVASFHQTFIEVVTRFSALIGMVSCGFEIETDGADKSVEVAIYKRR
jgi:hypothetical protein